jgi:hypothetical protein
MKPTLSNDKSTQPSGAKKTGKRGSVLDPAPGAPSEFGPARGWNVKGKGQESGEMTKAERALALLWDAVRDEGLASSAIAVFRGLVRSCSQVAGLPEADLDRLVEEMEK